MDHVGGLDRHHGLHPSLQQPHVYVRSPAVVYDGSVASNAAIKSSAWIGPAPTRRAVLRSNTLHIGTAHTFSYTRIPARLSGCTAATTWSMSDWSSNPE